MRLLRLDLHGFKSFPDRTTLHFGPGISCVVGPNGSGKSNVVDALRWCIGEQSAKSLRGSEMADVIFGGSSDRKPVGYAEVALTLTAEEDQPFPGDWAAFREVQVARRLHRSGASEYLLNQTRVRRKDVIDLLLDSGIGNNLYAFVEQGQVDRMITASAAERRSVIDEAAGIARYKIKREEARRRLEAATAQLERAADVLDEMERHLASLGSQALKAAELRRLRALVRQHEVLLALAKHHALAAERKALRRSLDESRTEEEAALREVARCEEDLGERRAELALVDAAVTTRREQVAELDAEGRELEARRQLHTRRGEELTADAERAVAEAEAAEEQKIEAEREHGTVGRDSAEVAAAIAVVEAEIATLAGVADELAGTVRDLRRSFDVAQDGLRQTIASRAALVAELGTVRRGCETLTRRAAEADEKLSSATVADRLRTVALAEVAAAEARAEQWIGALGQAWEGIDRGEIAAAEKDAEQQAAAKRTLLEQAHSATVALEKKLRSVEHERAALHVAPEGVDSGTPLLDRVNAGERERVIEVLGDRATLPIVTDPGALEALAGADVHAEVLFWPDGEDPPPLRVARAATIGEAIAHAARGVSAAGPGFRVDPDGVVRIGRSVRAARDAALADELANIRVQIVTAREAEQVAATAAAVADRALSEGREAARRFAEAAHAQLDAREQARRWIEQRRAWIGPAQPLDDLRGVAERAKAELEAEVHHAAALEHRAEAAVEAERLAAGEVENARDAVGAAEDVHLERAGALRRAEERMSALAERRATLAAVLAAAARRATEAEARRDAEAAESVRLRDAATAAHGEARAAEVRAGEVATRRGEAWDALEEERARAAKLGAALADAERIWSQARDAAAERGRMVVQLTEQLAAAQVSVETLRRSMDERYQLNVPALLDRLFARGELVLEADVDVAAGVTVAGRIVAGVDPLPLTPDTLTDEERIRDAVSTLDLHRAALAGLGEVNLGAQAAYAELDERRQALGEQVSDLEASVASIGEAIAKMNRMCRERFRETFDRVNDAFQAAYPQLVGGGSARLSLTDDEDLLETGVDIFVQPPGKRLQHLHLLSGGEKAMTAIALLIALFRVKPSPFCVLDEVDAPLDEANGARFNDVLRDMSRQSQFLVVTHNRKTMESADTVYGITMSRPGVSTLVSVSL